MNILYYFSYQVVQSSSLHKQLRVQTTTLPHAETSVQKSVSLRTQIRVQTRTLFLLIFSINSPFGCARCEMHDPLHNFHGYKISDSGEEFSALVYVQMCSLFPLFGGKASTNVTIVVLKNCIYCTREYSRLCEPAR